MQQKETPVFFDKSGKRWRVTENIIILFAALIGVAAYWITPLVLAEHRPPSLSIGPDIKDTALRTRAEERPSVHSLMQSLASKNIAVIGSGPLVRLIKIDQRPEGAYAADPFSQKILQKLNNQEVQFAGEDNYAIQRYGDAGNKQLFLTFDDGPDPTYTPQILDLLSRESVPSTFFVTGGSVAKFPEITKRILHEGHAIGNHTFSHIDFNMTGDFRDEQEINQTQRLIVATTGQETPFYRPPYGGNTDQSFRNSLESIITAQQFGYTVVSYDFDSNDWHFTSEQKPEYPKFDGNSKVILLHDGGGDRTKTITYTEEIIRRGKASGYSFASLRDAYSKVSGSKTTSATLADHASLQIARAVLVWPRQLIGWLFVFSIGTLIVMSLLNILLAIRYKVTTKHQPRSKKYRPHVTIILPSYNEEKVIEKSVRSLIRSRYRNISIVIVDDGSTDNTWAVVQSLAKRYKRVTALHQENGGKASALNNAIARVNSEIVICVDADTLFPAETIPNFVRHFEDETVGAVAGVVKVGNPHSILTRWQALEYISGISIERNAQALLNAIMIVPGACGAWRRSVLVEVGGFSSSTLAEDCDLALRIQQTRYYKILQDNEAISYTEAPQSLGALTKQRFRWTFGNIQSLWKHRNMILNEKYGWLGMYVMPSAIVAIVVPILFWPLVIALTVMNILSGNYQIILFFFVLSLAIQVIIAAIGTALARERYTYLLAIPFARFAYGPIRMYILYKTIFTILQGVNVGWNKLARTGTANDPLGANLALSTARPRKT